MSGTTTAVLTGGAVGVLASPYLARITLSVPDRDERRWWAGRPPGRGRLAATAAFALAFGLLGGGTARWTALLPAFVLYALVCAPLAVIDLEHQRLPDRLVVVLAVGGAVLLAVAAAHDDAWHELLRAGEGAAAVFAVLFAMVLAFPKGFGLGDVKIGGIVGGYLGWFGWLQVFYGIFAGFLLGSLVSIAVIATGRGTMKTAIPFGPMLMLGPLVVLAFGLVPRP